MPRLELSFADGFYVSQSGPLIEKRCVNVRPIVPNADAATKRALLHDPGISEIANTGGGSSRGVLVFSDGTPFRVIGNTLWSLASDGTLTDHGTITGTSDVSMDSNGINIAIQDPAGDSYFFTPTTNTLELNNDVVFLSFGQAETVAFKDGFYVYTTQNIFFSSSSKATNDGKDFNALDFADAEINPDLIRKAFNDHNQLYILGDTTTQVYKTIVTSGFPFQVIPGAIITKGTRSPNSVIAFDNSFLFMGGGLNEKTGIYQALGSSIQKISTQSIDQLIHGYSDEIIAKARAFAYAENGGYFAVFTVGDNTFVYDQVASQLSGKPEWHERQTGITNAVGFQPWRAIHGAKAYGCIQVGDDRSGLVGELDKDLYKEYGDLIEKFWSTKPFLDAGEYIFSHEIELFMKTGLGNADDDDPQIRFDYSDNGSRTFSNEISISMGKVGEYDRRTKWSRLGRIPLSRVLRWKTTAPVPIDAYGLWANAEGTSSG